MSCSLGRNLRVYPGENRMWQHLQMRFRRLRAAPGRRSLGIVLLGMALAAGPVYLYAAVSGAPPAQQTTAAAAAPDQHSGPVDINTASPAALRALPGMGDAYVRRIIDGRPYSAKNQLVTKGVLPAAAYDRIRDFIVAHRQRR